MRIQCEEEEQSALNVKRDGCEVDIIQSDHRPGTFHWSQGQKVVEDTLGKVNVDQRRVLFCDG